MKPHNSNFVVVSFKQPLVWARNMNPDCNESWMILPHRKYVLNANHLEHLEGYVESISDIKNAPLYKPFDIRKFNRTDTILIERYRERGIGDLLFLTGPMSYLHNLSGGDCKIDMFALADRGSILSGHPTLRHKAPLVGPCRYEDLAYYDQHFLVDTVTEYTDTDGQPNVYDAIYSQMGFDPSAVPAKFKRPEIFLNDSDLKNLDQFMYYVWQESKVDLRQEGYYVVAPSCRASLRAAPYSLWIKVIAELATKRPVVVVGDITDRMPVTDMTFGEFVQRLPKTNNVINALGRTPLRVLAALIKSSVAVGTMDSGPLYIAQAVRTPAVSVWGPHNPSVRIGYDNEYMDLAVWNKDACRRSPCYAFSAFPVDKCPLGEKQTVCHTILTTTPEMVLAKFNNIEKQNVKRI